MRFNREQAVKLIVESGMHNNYKRVVDLAKEYHDLLLCNDLGKYSKVYRQNESRAEHKQRMDIYISAIPSLLSEISKYFNKPLRTLEVYKQINLNNADQINKVLEMSELFYNSENLNGVDAFLQDKWDYYAKYDPNSVISVESSDTNIFPFVYESKDVLNYEKRNGNLQWMLVQDNERKLLYDDSGVHSLQAIETNDQAEGELVVLNFIRYDYHFYGNTSNEVRLRFAGVKYDPQTKNETYLSLFHDGIPYLKKEIQTGSEFDLTMRKHAFPQRAIIGKSCSGDAVNPACNNGVTIAGNECPVCFGSGRDTTALDSTQQILIVKESDNKVDQLYPRDIVHYYSPPVDLVKFQFEYIKYIHEAFKKAIFSQNAIKTNGPEAKTATEIKYDHDDIADTLYPYMRKYSNLWMFSHNAIINYLGFIGDSFHEFPSDIFPKTEEETLLELRAMKESGAPQSLLAELQMDWIRQRFSTDQDSFIKIKTKAKFQPFFGKTDDEVRLIIGGGINEDIKTLHNFFHVIFTEIEEDHEDFYFMLFSEQKAIVDSFVQKYKPEKVEYLDIDTRGLFDE